MVRGHCLKVQVLELETFEGALDLLPEASLRGDALSQLRGGNSRLFDLFPAR